MARKLNGEIISCDSMQVYKNLPTLTAQPPKSILKLVRHHLISILPLSAEYSAAKFIRQAKKKIKEIFDKGKIPIIVGGSGFYASALLDGLFQGPGEDSNLRRKLEKEATEFGNDYLYQRLQKLDPQTANEIHPHNLRRLVRAIEVCIKTGKKFSQVKRNRCGLWDNYDVKLIGLSRNRQELYQRIDKRVEQMFKKDVIKEVKSALNLPLSKTARQIIGINEIADYLEGRYNKEEARRLIERNSRHFAKRQLTWFKRDKRIDWIEIKELDRPEQIVQRIIKVI
ncbi:MAG: tRNA (adenosine(37)-N6)-dimethylallyltransferase MiaA [Candidatus Omnitrophota bacterium]